VRRAAGFDRGLEIVDIHLCPFRAVVNVHHKSSRIPLKNGCRTLPSVDLPRYSTSASSDGSTQTPRCAIFFVYGCVLRISGFSRACRSFADAGLKPWSTLPA
jgi:hypothetical protein